MICDIRVDPSFEKKYRVVDLGCYLTGDNTPSISQARIQGGTSAPILQKSLKLTVRFLKLEKSLKLTVNFNVILMQNCSLPFSSLSMA
jgi:hypothetical protein